VQGISSGRFWVPSRNDYVDRCVRSHEHECYGPRWAVVMNAMHPFFLTRALNGLAPPSLPSRHIRP
jgi:hypothetical protein